MADTAADTASLDDSFVRSQKQLLEHWAKAAATFQEALTASDVSQRISENTRQMFKLYDTWKKSTGRYLDTLLSASPAHAGTDTVSKLFRATDAYVKLYEFWEPLATALQEKSFDLDSYKDLVDPAKYGETIGAVFGFGSSGASAGLSGHASNLIETWGANAERFLRPWSDAMRASADASFGVASGDPEAGVAIFRHLHSAFERTFGKALNMPAVGKDREQVELLSRAVDSYAVYLAKNAELQRRMQTIAQRAMENVVQTMAQKVKDGDQIIGFGEFVKLWTTTNEQAFLEFFNTKQYSELQGIVLDTALDCRKQFQQLMELCLKDFPIALRSELDDLCKRNYTLNKSVRAMTKKTSEIDKLHSEIEDLKQRLATLEQTMSATSSGPKADGTAKERRAKKTAPRTSSEEVN